MLIRFFENIIRHAKKQTAILWVMKQTNSPELHRVYQYFLVAKM
jgi:hypothetical protein